MAYLKLLTILLGGNDCDHIVLQQPPLGKPEESFGTALEDNLSNLGSFDVDSMLNDEG